MNRMMRRKNWAVLLLGSCLLWAACAGPRETTREPAGPSGPSAPTPRETGARTVSGFRVQIFTTPQKAEADAQAADASTWWRTLPERNRASVIAARELPVYIDWRQPYYRVRIGDFATREEAERARALLARQYPDAFIVPDTVTLSN